MKFIIFFYLKSEKFLVFFVWSKMDKGSLGLPVLVLRVCKGFFRGLFGLFITPATHSHSELCAWNSKKKDGKWIVMLKLDGVGPVDNRPSTD